MLLEKIQEKEYNKINKKIHRFGKFMMSRSLEELREVCEGDEEFMFAFDMVEGYISEDDRVVTYDREELHEWEKGEILEHGLEQGRKEEQKKIVQKMYHSGMSKNQISKITELSKESVCKLLDC